MNPYSPLPRRRLNHARYDALNRLTSAQNAGTNCAASTVNGKTEYWGNAYAYDAWGNLLQKTITKCGAENLSLTAAVNNQLTGGYTYDAAGNMKHDATSGLDYSYDEENRINGAGGYTYTYDGDGNRVRKSNGTGASAGTLYWYMTPGIVAESDQAGTLKSEYVFFGGERVARRDLIAPTGVFYYFSDHLKTASVITDAAGNIKSESDYYPWGGELQFVANDSNHYKFTGKERDSESGLDYFGARYYSNGLGRFISADWSAAPVPVPYANFGDPQSLNIYTYARNIPTTRFDADGHDPMVGQEDVCRGQRFCENRNDGGGQTGSLGSLLAPSPKDSNSGASSTGNGPLVNTQEATQKVIKETGDALNAVGEAAALLDPSGGLVAVQAFAKNNNAEGAVFLGLMLLPGGGKAEEAVHVYQIVKDGKIVYVGITNNMARRSMEHGEDLERVVTVLSRERARAVEQALIQHHGLERNGGTLTNKINSMSPKRVGFWDAVALGFQILSSVGYHL